MKLEEIFKIVRNSNELQMLLGRDNNQVRVELWHGDKYVKGIQTDSYSELQFYFRSEFILGCPIYRSEFNQTNYCDIFQTYFDWMNREYYIEVTIVTK